MQADELIGRQFRDFTILERIGRGGMAVVYRASQASVNRDVALKVIQLQQEAAEDDFRRRFAQEAEMIASLEHIHILPIFDYGIVSEYAYLAMRLLRGGSLAELLRSQSLSMMRAADLFTQIARGLAYAHSKGVIHRDLKPSNILLDDPGAHGNAYLTDFGLAKLVEGSADITRSGNIVGTPAYMSPEQLRGEHLTNRSDIYSLGVILYQMLTGKQPFESPSGDVVSVIYRNLQESPTLPSELNPDVPPEVEEVIMTALQKKPEDRYETANEMADALNLALGRLTSTEMSTPVRKSSTQRRKEAQQRRRLMVIAGGITLALAAILLVVLVITLIAPPAVPTTPAVVLVGEQGTVDDYVPTDAEIVVAQSRLGDGFIAYIACTRDTAYHAAQAREVTEMLNSYGLATRMYDPQTDSYQQVTLVENALADGADAMMICPLDPDLLIEPLLAVENTQLPLVLFTSVPPSYGGVLLAGDEYTMGFRAGSYAGQLIAEERDGQATVLILDYPDAPQIVVRADGIEAGLLEFAQEANIVGRYRGGTPEFGQESLSALIEEGVEFDVIVSINDAGAFGAIEAMQDAGIDPSSVIVVGIDAEPRAQNMILDENFMRGSVEVGREEFSRAAVYAIIKLLAGATIPETLLVPPGTVITREILLTAQTESTEEAASP